VENVTHDPMGTMNNPLLSKTEDFFVAPAHSQDTVFLKGTRFYAKFFLTGLLIGTSVKQTGTLYKIAPEPLSWARFTSLLGSLYRERALYFTTYENGLSFSTRQYKGIDHTFTNNLSSPPRQRRETLCYLGMPKTNSCSITTIQVILVHAQNPDHWPIQVPVYDGRHEIGPFLFEDLPRLDPDDLGTNSAVLVTFHVAKYSSKAHKEKKLPPACSLNIKELILLTKPELDGDLLTEFSDIPPVNLDFARLPALSDFGRNIAGPSDKEKTLRRKQTEKQNEKIRAEKAKRAQM
jgi:hypothetical protein